MRQTLAWVMVLLLAAGCVSYFRGERYGCFSPAGVDKCKQPPYATSDPVPPPPDAY